MKIAKFILFYLMFCFSCYANNGMRTSTVTLAVANVAQSISSTDLTVYDFIIQNPASNSDSVFIGGSNVAISGAGLGIEIVPGASISLSSKIGLLTSPKIFIVSAGTAVPVIIGSISR